MVRKIAQRHVKILHYGKKDKNEFVALTYKGIDYLYIRNDETQMSSLLTGDKLIEEYMKLYSSGFDGCIECQISSWIKGGVIKHFNEIVEFDLTVSEANEIIKEINKLLLEISLPSVKEFKEFIPQF
ncbi:MAG: hypothetical protein ACTSR3_21605 [Candidatus Helarchaeota archaeon]